MMFKRETIKRFASKQANRNNYGKIVRRIKKQDGQQ